MLKNITKIIIKKVELDIKFMKNDRVEKILKKILGKIINLKKMKNLK